MQARFVWILVLLAIFPAITSASEPFREMGVFFDPSGTLPEASITGFFPFFIYVVGLGLDGGIAGYEGSVMTPGGFFDQVSNPSGFVILGATFLGSSGIIIVPPELTNFAVGTATCIESSPRIALVEAHLGYFAGPVAPEDVLFCLEPATPSSFVPATPGYLHCDGTLTPVTPPTFGGCRTTAYPPNCAVGNPTDVVVILPTRAESFGGVKARY